MSREMHCNKNGDFVITRGMLALVTVILLCIGALTTVVATGSQITSDIEHIKQKQALCDTSLNEIEDTMLDHERHIVSTDLQLRQLTDDIGEIKTDVKELVKR